MLKEQKTKLEQTESKVEEYRLKLNVAEQMKKMHGVSPSTTQSFVVNHQSFVSTDGLNG